MAVYFLRHTNEFRNSRIVRTRDEETINRADAVCDVGFQYDHSRRRYDHHQEGFNVTFPNCPILCASCGLVYIHFGREIIENILRKNQRDPGTYMEQIYGHMYHSFVKEIDANDNGIRQFDSAPRYNIQTSLSSRVRNLNYSVRNPKREGDQRFKDAVKLVGNEFEENLLIYFDQEIQSHERSLEIVTPAYRSRLDVDPSGHIVLLEENCNFKSVLRDLEREEARRTNNTAPKVFYVLFPSRDKWQCIALEDENRQLRRPLPCRGLKAEELSYRCGIPGGVFVHKNGFMCIFEERDNLIAFARYALQNTEEENQD